MYLSHAQAEKTQRKDKHVTTDRPTDRGNIRGNICGLYFLGHVP